MGLLQDLTKALVLQLCFFVKNFLKRDFDSHRAVARSTGNGVADTEVATCARKNHAL